MKLLYFIRHAKSSWEDPELTDLERPLLKRGIDKTRQMIRYLDKHKVTADLILSSPAVRALETARLIADGIGYPRKKIRIETAIYYGSAESIIDLVYSVPDEVSSLMIFGHNPLITEVANFFFQPVIGFLPTSGIACVSFPVDKWSYIQKVPAKQEFVISPKTLK